MKIFKRKTFFRNKNCIYFDVIFPRTSCKYLPEDIIRCLKKTCKIFVGDLEQYLHYFVPAGSEKKKSPDIVRYIIYIDYNIYVY